MQLSCQLSLANHGLLVGIIDKNSEVVRPHRENGLITVKTAAELVYYS